MSVLVSDTQASTSSTSDLLQATSRPEVKAPRPATASNGQTAANVSFLPRENQRGPVFGAPSSQAPRQSAADNVMRHSSAPAAQGLMNTVRHWMGPWFGWNRPQPGPGCCNPPPRPNPGCCSPPPRPSPGCSNPPPRPYPSVGKPYPPAPGWPDPTYSLKSNDELAQQLRDNFNAFRDRSNPGYVSVDSIYGMAKKTWSPNPVTNANIRLANELLRRPEVMGALDRHSSTGALDGLIDRQNVNIVVKGENYFKYKTDKEMAGEMLEHFDELKRNPWERELSFNHLRSLAAQEQTGDSPMDHLIQLSQEMLKRSNVLRKMDNLAGRDDDGRISWQALYQLSR